MKTQYVRYAVSPPVTTSTNSLMESIKWIKLWLKQAHSTIILVMPPITQHSFFEIIFLKFKREKGHRGKMELSNIL